MIALRELEGSDAAAIACQLNSENVARYLSSKIPFPYSLGDAKWFIEEGRKSGINRAVLCEGKVVGVVGMEPGQFEYQRSGEIGYWIGESHWGRGIATAAVSELSQYIFQNTDISRLVAPVFGPNVASMRVVQKCGFKLESIQELALFKHGKLHDCHVFVKLNP